LSLCGQITLVQSSPAENAAFSAARHDTSYEQAFDALKDGDFITAVPLLEPAAGETGYTSDVINHAYTLALHHADNKARLAEVSFPIGNSLEPAEWIPLASDVETRIQMFEPLTGLAMGLESASTVAATFGNLYKVEVPSSWGLCARSS
jgi:hypothetical protein